MFMDFPSGATLRAVGALTLPSLAADHQRILQRVRECSALIALGEPDPRPALADLARALHMHDTLEDELVYPLARAAGMRAAFLDDAALAHAITRALLAEAQSGLQRVDERLRLLAELETRLARHAREEEELFFPRLAARGVDLDALETQLRDAYASLSRALAPAPARLATAATSAGGANGLASSDSNPASTSRV